MQSLKELVADLSPGEPLLKKVRSGLGDLTLEYSLSSTRRFIRLVGRIRNGEAKRIDKYHSMERYLDKLAAIARRYN